MISHARICTVMLAIGLSWMAGGRVCGQTQIIGPGSTPQGDILRGEGIFYQGLGWYELNDAKAMALNFETWRKMEQWNLEFQMDLRRSYNAKIAEKMYRDKRQYEEAQRKHEEREVQLRTKPMAEDIRKGDALNALLTDLSDPNIPPASWQAAQVPLPVGITIKSMAMRFSPKKDAKGSAVELSKGLIALGRLDTPGHWPDVFPLDRLAVEIAAYETTYNRIKLQALAGRINPDVPIDMDKSLKLLRDKVNTVVPTERGYRNEAIKFVDRLIQATAMFNGATLGFAREMMADTNRHEAHTVGELLAFMRKYRLRFAEADQAPGGEEMYTRLYQLLREQKDKLGIQPPTEFGIPARPAVVVAQDGFQQGAVWTGTWKYQDNVFPGSTGTIRLTVTSREGANIAGTSDHKSDNPAFPVNECTFHGSIRGNRIILFEKGRGQYSFQVNLLRHGDNVELEFQGTGIEGRERFGIGSMTKAR